MMERIASVILLAAAALGAAHPAARPANPLNLSAGEISMIEAVNDYRDRYRLCPLTVDPILMRVARARAPYFNHCPRGMGWCWEHARRVGYDGFATDNLAMGDLTPQSAAQGWARSDGHARQMRGQRKLNGRWQDFGATRIGVANRGRNYIAIFGN